MKSRIKTPLSLEKALSLVDASALPTAEQIEAEAMRQLLNGQSDRVDLNTGDELAKNDFVRLKVASSLPRFDHDTVGVWLGGGLYDETLENEIIGKRVGDAGSVTARDVEVKYEVLSGSRPVARVASDELVESLGLEGIHTVADYVADVAAKINDTVSMNQLGTVWGYVAENAQADVADEDVDVYQAQMRQEMEANLRRKGVDPTKKLPAEFVEIYGTDDFDAYIKGSYENSRGQIQLFLGFCSLVDVEPVGEYDYLENGGAFAAVVQKVQEKISDKLAGRNV